MELQGDGKIIQEGKLNLDINPGPQKRKYVTIPFTKPEIKAGAEYRSTCKFPSKGKQLMG